MIGRSGERGSGISVLAARHVDDDDDDDDYISFTDINLLKIISIFFLYTHRITTSRVFFKFFLSFIQFVFVP